MLHIHLGDLIGIGFAAMSDIWINGFPPAVAVVGEFLPAAGPNLIFAAILVPILVVAYEALQRQTGCWSSKGGGMLVTWRYRKRRSLVQSFDPRAWMISYVLSGTHAHVLEPGFSNPTPLHRSGSGLDARDHMTGVAPRLAVHGRIHRLFRAPDVPDRARRDRGLQ